MDLTCLPFALVAALAAGAGPRAREPAKAPPPTGHLQLTFAERHPLGSADEVSRRVFADYGGLKDEEKAKGKYELADESFEVFVPPGYKAGVPHGLFVFISAGEARVAPDWFDVFSRRKLIWVCANNSGNGRNALVRLGLALDAVHNMKARYDLDDTRIYISGFSAGSQLATWMVRGYPDVFRGGCFLMGGSFYRNRKREDGTWEPTVQPTEPATWNGPLDRLRKDLRLVIVKGERDTQWTAAEGRADYEALLLDGFERVSLLEVPRVGHTHPSAAWLDKAVVALDAKPKKPPATAPTAAPRPLPSQQAQAKRILATGQMLVETKALSPTKACPFFQRVLDEYPTTPAAGEARELLKKHDLPATQPQKG